MDRNWQFWVGLGLAVAAAGLMFEGGMLGEDTTGIATVVLIVGLGLIAASRRAG